VEQDRLESCTTCGRRQRPALQRPPGRVGQPAGETAAEAASSAAHDAAGQRSDTIKIVRVDPATGTASSLSIPRDTYVTLSDMAANSQISSQNKINAAFSNGPTPHPDHPEHLRHPISHYIVINFFGLQDAVNALGGISMNFPTRCGPQHRTA